MGARTEMKTILMMTILLGLLVSSCRPRGGKEAAVTASEMQLKDIPAITVASISRTGSFAQISETTAAVFAWLGQKGIQPMGPPIGLYYDNPEEVPEEKLRWDICVPVAPGTTGEGQVTVKDLPGGRYLVTIYEGPYENIGETYGALFARILGDRDLELREAPCCEVYLSDPRQVPPEKLLTEVRMPIK